MKYKVIFEELTALFDEGRLLSAIKLPVEKPFNPYYAKPFMGVLADNLHLVTKNQEFNGEPFIKGKFLYKRVMLPEVRCTYLPDFYKKLTAILNGYYICKEAGKDCLKSLANDIYLYYAPLHHIYTDTPEKFESHNKIDIIIDSVIKNPRPFNGRGKNARIIWNPDYDFTGNEKRTIERQYRAKTQIKSKIDILTPHFEKGISISKIVKLVGVSESTVKRYKRKWKESSLDLNIIIKRAA